jgi:hypothetical protein
MLRYTDQCGEKNDTGRTFPSALALGKFEQRIVRYGNISVKIENVTDTSKGCSVEKLRPT